MNTENILNALSENDFKLAAELCEPFVHEAKGRFADELTVNTATDFLGATVLMAEIFAKEKKPWKAVPYLDDAKGALRFLADFMEDRTILSSAFETVAGFYSYAGFLPEAIFAWQSVLKFSENPEQIQNAFFQLVFLAYRYGDLFPKEGDWSDKIDRKTRESLLTQAKEAFEAQIMTDPIENTPEYLKIRFDLEKAVDEALSKSGAEKDEIPFCLRYWRMKKRVLSEQFSLNWKSPEDCNPDLQFR